MVVLAAEWTGVEEVDGMRVRAEVMSWLEEVQTGKATAVVTVVAAPTGMAVAVVAMEMTGELQPNQGQNYQYT